EFLARYARQLQFYVYALQLQNKTVSNAELVDVAASTKAKKLVTTSVDINKTTISKLIENCQRAIEGIQKAKFQPNPSPSVCGCCDVRRLCAAREGGTIGKTEN